MEEFRPRTEALLGTLTLEEKAALTAGSGFFSMTGVDRVGLPNWQTTDGPNGARGSSFLGSGDSKATCIPCGSALGATWNPALVEELGEMLGRETRTKACRVLLAPTVNLHRSPLAGRNFECFSEDPLLSGKLAAAYVRGVQSQGVIATVKHFIGNECETDRWTSNSIIDDRALRELYLVPFEIAVKEAGALGIMTSYNRVNGSYCTEQRWLLTDVLRDEWGFEGIVTTDWLAGADTVRSADAGLTIEMPGGDRAFGSVLAKAVADGSVPEATLDHLAGRLLSTFEAIRAWDDEPAVEQSIDRTDHRDLARRAASEAMVLLRNVPFDGQPVLPLDIESISSIALIGPNAGRAQIMGGGSANLRPFHRTSPRSAFERRLGGEVTISHAAGCNIDKQPPLLGGPAICTPDGEQGIRLDLYDNVAFEGAPVAGSHRETSRILFGAEPIPGHRLDQFAMRATTLFSPDASGEHAFRLTQVSPSRLFVDGELVADGVAGRVDRSTSFFGYGTEVEAATLDLEFGQTYELVIEMVVERILMFGGLDLRVEPPSTADAMQAAVDAAAAADVAIVVVGTNDDWETEGEDRESLRLPGDQDALVSAVVAANPRTVVIVNTGAPVSMPWSDEVPAIVQSWLGGQEMADALVDVITGAAEPGGRLPTTFPRRIEHTPSYGNFPGDNGQVVYAESLFIGYRWYDSRHLPVLFPFGHGGSYTTFEIGAPTVSSVAPSVGDTVTVDVPITNTGERAGSHVVQCYVRPEGSRIVRPDQELKAFIKVWLSPGESSTVTLTLDERAFAYWDPAQPEWPALRDAQAATLPQLRNQERRTEAGWTVEPGKYDIVIANSAADAVATVTIDLR